MTLSKKEIVRSHKKLRELLKKIEESAFFCAQPGDLIQGVASMVSRRCGKKNCKCMHDDNKRHGPYFIAQLYENQKQRQVVLRNEEEHLWQLIKDYQEQIRTFLLLKSTCSELCSEVARVIKKRLKKMKR